jgi:hypothetical protein
VLVLDQIFSSSYQDFRISDFKMASPMFQDEKKEPIPAYVEGSDPEGEIKSFSALIEEGKLGY